MKIERLPVNIARRRLREKFGRDGFGVDNNGVISVQNSAGAFEKVGHIENGFAFLPSWRDPLTDGRTRNVYIDGPTFDKAKRIGNGNLSRGLRLAVQSFRE